MAVAGCKTKTKKYKRWFVGTSYIVNEHAEYEWVERKKTFLLEQFLMEKKISVENIRQPMI